MKVSVVVPTYISRASNEKWQEKDAIYDHPTPLDKPGTLVRFLESIKNLKNKHFELIIIISTTTPDINKEAFEKVVKDIKSVSLPIPIYLFTEHRLKMIKNIIKEHNADTDILNIRGYPNVRNLCLYVPYIMGSDVSILIDDDEVFEDPEFINKSLEFIGKRFHGKTIDGVAGYYLNKKNEFYDDVKKVPWMTYWDRFGSKTEAFDLIIGKEPRLKETPFAFGGAMVIHRNLFKVVPFDPKITRGEDIDYLINAKMFGFNFFLDRELSIKHLPPKKYHPIWQRLREDIMRFLYEKAKIDSQYSVPNLTKVTAETFFPYPGHFLDHTLEDKIFKTNIMLALDYLSEGDIESAKETIKNIYLAKYDSIPKFNVFQHLRDTQKIWRKVLVDSNTHCRDKILQIINENKFEEVTVNKTKRKKFKVSLSTENIIKQLEKIDFLTDLRRKNLKALAELSSFEILPEGHVIFNEGDITKGLFIIVQGEVILKRKLEGIELDVATIKDEEPLGEISMISKGTHTVKAITKTETKLITIKRRNLLKLFDENPILAQRIYRNIAIVIANRMKSTSNELAKLKKFDTDISSEMKEV